MALEVTAFRSLYQPLFIRKENEEPRKVHWVGNNEPTSTKSGGNKPSQPPERITKRGYRNLSNITLGEVSNAYKLFADQLVTSPTPTWIAPNTFCMIEIAQRGEDRPPAVFGRVKTCYPSDGYIQNIQEMELYFPQMDASPEVVHLQASDITGQIQSYCLRLKFHIIQDEVSDFSSRRPQFLQQGFFPEFHTSYLDFLEFVDHKASVPPLLVISSHWFASAPESVKPEIREKLARLVSWNTLIFDYHPGYLPAEIHTLNKVLGLKAGFSEVFLLEPETPEQTLQIIQRTFDAIFMKARK